MTNDALQTNEIRHPRFLLFRMLFELRTLKWFGLLLLLFGLLGYVAFHIGVEFWFKKQIDREYSQGSNSRMTISNSIQIETQLGEIREFWDTIVRFPAGCYKEPVQSKELSDAYLKIAQAREDAKKESNKFDCGCVCQNWTTKIFHSPNLLTEEEWKSFNDDLNRMDAFIQAGMSFVEKMEREIQTHQPGADFPVLEYRYSCGELFQALKLKAFSLSHAGRYDEAADCLCRAFMLHLANPYQNLDAYCNGLWNVETETRGLFNDILPFIQNAQHLQEILDRLNRIEPFLFQNVSNSFRELWLWNKLTTHQRVRNIDVDFSSGRKASYYIE